MKFDNSNKSISVGGRATFLSSEIVMLKSELNYTRIFLKEGNTFFVATPLKILEKRLPVEQFVRTHRAFMINLQYIKEYQHPEYVLLVNDCKAAVSRRKRIPLLQKIL